jgi:PAS domain S-box-containing protein
LLFDDTDVMRFVGWRGLSDNYRKATEGHSPWKSDEKNPEPIGINDIDPAEINDSLKAIIKGEGIGALAFIPLVSNGRLIGKFMTYFNAPHVFSDNELELSLTIARELAFGIDRKRADTALRENEARFRALANVAPSMIWTAAPDGTITYANEQWFNYVGITPEANARNWPELVLHPDDVERCVAQWTQALQTGSEYEIEVRNRRYDGEYRWFLTRAVPVHDAEGRITAWFGTSTDIHERKRAELEERLLAEAGKVLASSLDPTVRLSNVVQLAVPDLADWCAVTLVDDDRTIRNVAVAHVDPAKVELAHDLQRRYPPRPEELAKMAQPWQMGQSELYPEITEAMLEESARDAEHYQILHDLNLRSAMVIPLVARGRVLGVMFFVWAESGNHYDEQDLELAEELVRRAAIALDNVRLYEAEQRARQTAEETAGQIAALQAVTAALSVALTPAEVSEVIIQQSISVLEASGGAVMLVTEEGESLEIVRATGYSEAGLKPFLRFPLAVPIPASDAVRSGEPVWITSHHDFEARYPHLASTRPTDSRTEGVAVVPLLVEGRALGAIAVSFDEVQEFSAEDKDFLETLASLCAQALERAHLYEAERRARAEAEVAGERLSLLAEASEILTASPDYETNLANLVRLVVPSLADWWVVDVIKEDGLIHRLAVVHHDPAKAKLAARLQQDYPALDPQEEHTIAKAIRRGSTWFDPEVSQTRLAEEARDEEHLELLRGLGFASEMVVPLMARGRTLGTLTFVRATVERRYEMADLTLAEELARRAAIAVDNAQLYEAERKARVEAEAAQHSLALLAEARERNRLAQELHDNVAQALGYLNLKIASLPHVFASNQPEKVRAELSELKQVVGEAYTDIRGEIFNLRAGPSDEINFLETLRRYIDKYKRFYQLDIQLIFETDEAHFEFPAQVSVPLIRTIQEALMNVRKHAQIDQAFLRLSRAGDQIRISVEDKGQGFDPTHEKASSFGLKIMRERIESIGGRLEIESLPGQGTRVTLLYSGESLK